MLEIPSIAGDAKYSDDHFGGNLLAPRGDLLGDGSYAEAVEYLGVSGLRYPGGSLTEYMFDITDPDAEVVYDPRSDEEQTMIGLTDFMSYALDADQPVTIVVPTRTQTSENYDENGDRYADIDEAELRAFVQDLAAGEYGEARIQAFEIGNEYWGSGEMSALEYGRVASEMATIINDELEKAGNFDTDIVVQKGNNFGFSRLSDDYDGVPGDEVLATLNELYGVELDDDALFNSGDVNWGYVNSKLVLSSFDTDVEKEAVDGVVTHIYSRGDVAESTRYFDLDQINDTWAQDIPGVEIYITEWNLKSTPGLEREEDYGLFQGQEMLQIMEEFGRTGVDKAHVWPLIQNTRNALAEGQDFDAATPPGEMFALMSETLPGKVLLDFQEGDKDTEAEFGDVSVHMFAGEGELAFYVMNGSKESAASADIDLSSLVSDYNVSDILVLGVEDEEMPGSNKSQAVIEELDASIMQGGKFEASLSPGEIMQVVLTDVVPTEGFEDIWDAANSVDPFAGEVIPQPEPVTVPELEPALDPEPAPEPVIPDVPLVDVSDDDAEDVGAVEDDDGDMFAGLGWAGGLLLLLAAGAGGFAG
ncbi:type I secretion protein [uncultured Tateyamaria sp.]|uniref:type I secretion protein n=1 Tax=uncultured Tateyamaria sp. TaxID=455651 RepID=UPI00262F8D3F|nr:type I secretion protein [uncultured Tateyamaria sp.]